MELNQDHWLDVRERLAALGCLQPSTLSILPLNLETASSPSDFVFPTSTATVHTLFRNADLSYADVLPDDLSRRYRLDRADDLVLPTLLVMASWLHKNRAALRKALNLLVDYLQRRFSVASPSQVSLDVVQEKPDGTFAKMSYTGPLEGLPVVLDAIDSQSPPRELPQNE